MNTYQEIKVFGCIRTKILKYTVSSSTVFETVNKHGIIETVNKHGIIIDC